MQLVFAPSRRDFIELVGYAGLLEPPRQPELWIKNATTWTTFWMGWTLVIGLEYPSWTKDDEFKLGASMNKYEPTGMVQHVVQQAQNALLWMCYGENDALYLEQALALNMAIEVCGEANALEGDSGHGNTGAHTDPYEKFVPGAPPPGGALPAIPAAPLDQVKVNQWRKSLGKDHFAGPLRKGQKDGAKQVAKERPANVDPKLVKDKNAHFLLLGSDEVTHYVVSAPFFGAHAKEKPYPPVLFIIDYREFFRAYRSGFFHWLQTQADPAGAEPSAEKFRTLLKKLATREPDKSFEALVAEVYGVPLSDRNGEVDSLEWRYLGWLAKGK